MAAVFLSGCFGSKSRLKVGKSAEGEVVEAEGFAPYEPKDILKTKRGSLVDAQRNAVEKAVGVYVTGKTMVEQAVAIENNILAKSDGYIKKFDVLSEGKENDLYKTRIRALVALKDLQADLKDMSLLKKPDLLRPRLTIDIMEKIDKQKTDERVAANTLQKGLTDKGFVILDGERAKEADLAVKGQASALPFQQTGLGGFVSYRARLSVEAMRPGTKTVVTSLSREASGLGGNEELAGYKALETVGELVAGDLAAELTKAWGQGKNLLVMVEGVKNFNDVDRVKKHLSSQPGINDLALRFYDEGMAQFDVILDNVTTAEIAGDVQRSKTLPLEVLETSPQTLRLKLN